MPTKTVLLTLTFSTHADKSGFTHADVYAKRISRTLTFADKNAVLLLTFAEV